MSRVKLTTARCPDPLTPRPLSARWARGESNRLPSPPWGRGWLDEAFSSAEARRVRGSRLLSKLMWDTTLGHPLLARLLVLNHSDQRMSTEQELTRAAERLHTHLLQRHYSQGLVHGPDAGVRFQLRLWRFFKAALDFLPWQDDYVLCNPRVIGFCPTGCCRDDRENRNIARWPWRARRRRSACSSPKVSGLYPLPERKTPDRHRGGKLGGDWTPRHLCPRTAGRISSRQRFAGTITWSEASAFSPTRPERPSTTLISREGKFPTIPWRRYGSSCGFGRPPAMRASGARGCHAGVSWQAPNFPPGSCPTLWTGPYEKGRVHYLCYQYNAFQFLKLAWAAALRADPPDAADPFGARRLPCQRRHRIRRERRRLLSCASRRRITSLPFSPRPCGRQRNCRLPIAGCRVRPIVNPQSSILHRKRGS